MGVVIFARGGGIENQVKYCKEYAEREGYTVTGVITGQGQELPEVIKGLKMDIDRVIVRDMARISRNAIEAYAIQAELELDCGVKIEVADEDKREEATEKIMRNIIMEIMTNENILYTRERIQRGFEFHRRNEGI